MRNLIRLQLIFNRRQILFVLAMFAVYIGWMVREMESPRAFLVVTALLVGLGLPFGFVGREDKFKTAALVCSLPVRRSDVVRALYAVSWAAIAAGLLFAFGMAALMPFSRAPIGEMLEPRSILAMLVLISLLLGAILPFTIRFGMTGLIAALVGIQVLGIVMLILTELLGPGNPLRPAVSLVFGAVRGLFDRPATPAYLAGLGAAIAALNGASFLAARALYARREL